VGFLIAILALALLGLVVVVLSAPLRRTHEHGDQGTRSPSTEAGGRSPADSRDELEAAREAKYREIRDAELDYRTGKLSREDYDAINAGLRAEAIEILDRLERLTPREP
jgi:hypothetical protein